LSAVGFKEAGAEAELAESRSPKAILDSGKPAGVPGTAVIGVPGVQVLKADKKKDPLSCKKGSVVGIQF